MDLELINEDEYIKILNEHSEKCSGCFQMKYIRFIKYLSFYDKSFTNFYKNDTLCHWCFKYFIDNDIIRPKNTNRDTNYWETQFSIEDVFFKNIIKQH